MQLNKILCQRPQVRKRKTLVACVGEKKNVDCSVPFVLAKGIFI